MIRQVPRDGFGGIAFLHTAPGHVATFGVLMTELAPNVPVRQTVRAELLEAARAAGGLTPDIAAVARRELAELAANGARVVVCTCSTIGGCLATGDSEPDGILVADRPWTVFQRIDAPMAEAAARLGGHSGRILVVATVEESLASASILLKSTSRRPVTAVPLLVRDAWPLFEAGERPAYRRRIVEAVRAAVAQPGGETAAVVLAQASMAPAADDLADLDVPVLSSPRLGVAAAVAAWREISREAAQVG